MTLILWKLLEVAVLFAVSFFGPGFFFVRQFSWTGAEKLAAAFGLSVLTIGVTTSLLYLWNSPKESYWAVTALCVGALWVARAEWIAAWREPDTQRMAATYGLVVLWMLGCIGLVRTYSGGGWAGDWAEHYDRCRFYLKHWPLDTKFIETYALPARPPLMNLATVHMLAMVGPGFPLFQVVSALLNLGVVFPAYLIARRVAGERAFPLLLLVALLAFNPMLVENTVYPWTKLLAAAFVALGTWFYITGWERTERQRIRLAVICIGAGIITHYSAAPFALFFAAHYTWRGSRAFADRIGELLRSLAVALAVVAPWVLWALKNYGAAVTFGGNTSAEGYASRSIKDNVAMVISNVWNTLIPHQLRHVDYTVLGNNERWSRLRDDFFFLYQTNALFMLGAAGALAMGYTLWQQRPSWRDPQVRFWIGFAATALLLGLASNGAPDMFGLAHISLQPLALVVVAALAGAWTRWPERVRYLLLGGLAIDLVAGVALPVLVQARLFGEQYLAQPSVMANVAEPTSYAAASNWQEKMGRPLTFLGDVFLPISSELLLTLVLFAAILLGLLVRRQQADASPP
jgi:hypothetical protein